MENIVGLLMLEIILLDSPGQGRPMKSKEAKNVASFLFEIFMTFGAPRILHSDNGKEFAAQIIKDLIALYPKLS